MLDESHGEHKHDSSIILRVLNSLEYLLHFSSHFCLPFSFHSHSGRRRPQQMFNFSQMVLNMQLQKHTGIE